MFGGPQRTRLGTRAEQEEKWRDVRRGEGAVARTGRSVLARESRGKGHTDRGGPSGDHGGRSLGDRLGASGGTASQQSVPGSPPPNIGGLF